MLKVSSEKNINFFLSFALPVIFPIMILSFWEYAALNRYVSPAIIPAPTKIYASFSTMLHNGVLFRNIRISLVRVISGYALGTLVGVLCGILLGLFRFAERSVILFIGILRPIPMIALVPLFILFFGIGEISKIAVITVGAFWPAFLNTQHGIKNVDWKLLDVAYALRKNRWETLAKIIFPSALPSVFVGAKLGASSAWVCVVAAEMIAASSGIGYMVMFARETSQTAVMYMGILVIGLFGLLIDFCLTRLQRRLLSWNTEPNS
jgi:sulfonate transport system permease protein